MLGYLQWLVCLSRNKGDICKVTGKNSFHIINIFNRCSINVERSDLSQNQREVTSRKPLVLYN